MNLTCVSEMLFFVHYFRENDTFHMLRPRRLNVEIIDDFVSVGRKPRKCFKLAEKRVIIHFHYNIMTMLYY